MGPTFRRRTLACAMLALAASGQLAGHQTALNIVSTAQTAAGELDPTFSGDGKQTTDFGGDDYGVGVAVQADGKILIAGQRDRDFALARYNADGSLDTTFSDDGKLTTDFGGQTTAALDVAIQADGKIVAAGRAGSDFALARYNADGSLDPTFSDDGTLTTDFGGDADAAYGVALQGDGKIVAAGYAGLEFAVARYNADGSLDASFSGDGKQTTQFGGLWGSADLGVALQADGKIVAVGGCCASDVGGDFALARYNADGSLDTTFSGDGKQTTDFSGDGDVAYGVALQGDGKIVAAGYAGLEFALARYNTDGSLDASFSGDGKQTTQFFGGLWGSAALGVALQPDGKIVAVGVCCASDVGGDFALARYNPDGSLDTTFSGDGTQSTDFGFDDAASDVAFQPDGKIVIVGWHADWSADYLNDFALARYYNDGSGPPEITTAETAITGCPTGTINDSLATFTFDSSEGGSTFECRVDGGAFSPCISPHTKQSAPPAPNRLIRVMTQNVYHGVDAEIFAVPQATSQADLLNKVAAVYHGYFARNFPERAAALALEISLTLPDLIGLQEAILVRTQQPADGSLTPATKVELDYVQILVDALAARGLAYKVVTQSIGFDIELPSALGFDVRHTDREVILARADLKATEFALLNPLAGNFAVSCQIPTGFFGPIPIRRGWVSVDASVRGRSFRFLSTHLDGDCLPFTSAFQQAQAAELLAGPAATELPLVLVGDLNSPADGSGVTYNTLTGGTAAFTDTWTMSGFGAGLTCCQADDLLNVDSSLIQRIDFVLFRGPFTPLAAITVGDQPLFKTASGMWPSDHAGVVAGLLLRP